MAKKSAFGVNTYRDKKRVKRKGRHSKSPNKSAKRSSKPYVGQGRV